MNSDGFYEIAPATDANQRLDVSGGSSDNGANVQIWGSNGGLAQRWWIRGTGDGWYTLTSCCGAKALDVSNFGTNAGTNVQQWDRTGVSAQRWRFAMGEYGLELVSACGDNLLTVSGANLANGSNVQVDPVSKTLAKGQCWRVCGAPTPTKIGWQNPSWAYQVSTLNTWIPGYASWPFNYVTASRIAYDASRSDCVEAMIGRAYEYLNVSSPYMWGYSCAPEVGVDCSGLVIQALEATGLQMPYNSWAHMYDDTIARETDAFVADSHFMHVNLSDRQRGDLIFYPGHVAIYLGNDQIIEANHPCVMLSSIWKYSTITYVVRVFM